MDGIFQVAPFLKTGDVVLFMLVMARTAGLLIMLPIFTGHTVPTRVKAVIIFAMTLVLAPVVKGVVHPFPASDTLALATAVVCDLFVGVSLGFPVALVIAAVEFAGNFIGMQAGISMMSMFDPSTGNNSPFVSVMQASIAMVLFFCFNVHHAFIRLLMESYGYLPLGAEGVVKFGPLLLSSSAGMFVMAVKIAAPVVISLFAVSLALGVLAKAFPAMNVFTLSFPVNIGVALMLLGVTAYTTVALLSGAYSEACGKAHALLQGLSR